MPVVEKVRGGRVHVRGIGRFAIGDQADVSEAEAEYLVEERGDFEAVDVTESDTAETESLREDSVAQPESGTGDSATTADIIDRGVCPWCDEYEGDGVPQHAASAHPDEWGAYKED